MDITIKDIDAFEIHFIADIVSLFLGSSEPILGDELTCPLDTLCIRLEDIIVNVGIEAPDKNEIEQLKSTAKALVHLADTIYGKAQKLEYERRLPPSSP